MTDIDDKEKVYQKELEEKSFLFLEKLYDWVNGNISTPANINLILREASSSENIIPELILPHLLSLGLVECSESYKYVCLTRDGVRMVQKKLRPSIDARNKEEVEGTAHPKSSKQISPQKKEVFIVHGHDKEAKLDVARFIEKLGLEAIILHEQPNKGRVIIEKLEDYAETAFAVVILTPDDVGAPKDERDKLQPRARQNVIFELGLFIGKLGRDRVCALYKKSDEGDILSDLSDYKPVLYTELDPRGAWKSDLAKEIKASGIEVDLNKVK